MNGYEISHLGGSYKVPENMQQTPASLEKENLRHSFSDKSSAPGVV